MKRSPIPAFSPFARRLIACLLALLAPLQGLAAGVIAAVGPAHTHKPLANVVVLEDFRRAPTSVATEPTHVVTAFGHFHGTQALRHHHARGDTSIVLADGAALQANGDGEELSVSPTLAAFVALLPASMPSLPGVADSTVASHAPWALQTHHPALPERPPRVG